MKLDSLKVLKMMEPNFWKIVQPVRRAQKSQKWGFGGILKEISSIHMYFLLLEYEITNFLWKLHIWKKSGFRVMNQKL